MGWLAFVASLVHSLAWPAGVVAVVVVLRKHIGVTLDRGIRRLKAGPVEVEFDQIQAEVREELARSPELAKVPVSTSAPSLREGLSRLAVISPTSAVMEAYRQVELRLREMLDGPDVPPHRTMGGRGLARLARKLDLISDETLAAIEGLSALRDLTAHVSGDISIERARDYLALADGVMYVLRSKSSAERADQG